MRGSNPSMAQLGCHGLLFCGSLATQVLISKDAVNFNSTEYNPNREILRKKVQIALKKYFKHTSLPESYENKIATKPLFLDVIAKKVQMLHPDAELLTKPEFYDAVKKVIGREAVGRSVADHKEHTSDLDAINLEDLKGLDVSIYEQLNIRFGPDRLNIVQKREETIKSVMLDARKITPAGTDTSKPNQKLAKTLVKQVILNKFDNWYDDTDGIEHTGFKSFLAEMLEEGAEALATAVVNTDFVSNIEKLTKDGSELVAKANDFVDEASDLVSSIDDTVDAVGGAANAVADVADGGASLTVTATATVEVVGADAGHTAGETSA